MRRRVFESLGVAAVLAALVVLLQLSAQGQGERWSRRASGARSQNGLGPPRSAGHLARRVSDPARTPRTVRQPRVPHRGGTRSTGRRAVRQHRPQPPRRARQPAGRRRRVQRRLHVREADGPSDVAGRRAGERPDSRADAADAGAEPARSGIPPRAAAEHRHLQEQGAGLQRRDVRAAFAAPRRSARSSTTRSA